MTARGRQQRVLGSRDVCQIVMQSVRIYVERLEDVAVDRDRWRQEVGVYAEYSPGQRPRRSNATEDKRTRNRMNLDTDDSDA